MCLAKLKLPSRKMPPKPLLIQTVKYKRLASCECCRNGTVEDWKKVRSTIEAILS
jgi:hypothetical protein